MYTFRIVGALGMWETFLQGYNVNTGENYDVYHQVSLICKYNMCDCVFVCVSG